MTDFFIASPGGNKYTSTYGSGKPVYYTHCYIIHSITYACIVTNWISEQLYHIPVLSIAFNVHDITI